MSGAVILSACRTPIGKFQGTMSAIPATQLGATVVQAAIKAASVDATSVEEVIFGMVLPAGTGQAPARQVALRAQIPPTVAALTINKVCGSGLKAVMLADQAIRCADASVVVAGGMECMSQAPWLIDRRLNGIGDRVLIDSMLHDGLRCGLSSQSMGEIAESLATREGIRRIDQDSFARESHRRSINAANQNLFRDETISVTAHVKSAIQQIERDEGPRADCSLEKLSLLSPAFHPDGSVTAGNAAMISDGAAAVVVASANFANERQLKPLAEIVGATTAGVAPEDLFVAPVEAVRNLLAKTNLQVENIDLWEINEAFAVQMLVCQRRLRIADDRLNKFGGAIALGHPIGASGARILTTLVHSLIRENKELGIAALCLGGGNAVAMLVKRF